MRNINPLLSKEFLRWDDKNSEEKIEYKNAIWVPVTFFERLSYLKYFSGIPGYQR